MAGNLTSSEHLRMARDTNPYAAAGRAAGMIMQHSSFGELPFSQIMRLIAGQVNRGHYNFAMRGNKAVGYFGWALSSEEAAEHWLMHSDDTLVGDGTQGDCVIFNMWHAVDKETNYYGYREMRKILVDKKMYFGLRRYKDGSLRPYRIKNSRYKLAQ